MYRLAFVRKEIRCFALLSFFLVGESLVGCASLPKEGLDPPLTETLRLRISKARNAIRETRRAIMRAQGKPYQVELELRLAELLSEEASIHYQISNARESSAARAGTHVPQVQTLKRLAVEGYERIMKEHPSSPLIPRVLFNLAQEHRELGDFEKMRTHFERLIQDHPESPLRPEGLLVCL